MTADRDNDTETAGRKRPAKKLAKKPRTTLAARTRHHTDRHPEEIADIDLNSKWPDFELQALLTILRPLLQRAIEVSKRIPTADQQEFAAGYHNITICQH